ncbi:hypothetical protein [Acrocarpospora catenulata]|uniref:hypothetical protein n=1 Tax=Acrocarpospora catenulata TaxID=2836182 RepID=UPI001BDB63C4|nr:hypothetical protein [Acrocarpospora catenulata]
MRTRLLVVCLLPLLLATAVACAESPGGGEVASVDGSAAPSATPSLSRLAQLIKYSQCMRGKGVPMADPQVDGDLVREGKVEGDADKDKVDAAKEACKQYRPPQEGGPVMALKQDLARRFARCMREHGVEEYPDPNPDGPTRGGAEREDPQYPEAKQTCDAQIDAAFASSRPSPS